MANLTTILLGTATLAVFVATRRQALRLLLTVQHARAWRQLVGWRALWSRIGAIWRNVGARLDGEWWLPADEIESLLGDPVAPDDRAGWPQVDPAFARDAYRRLARRLQRSLIIRLSPSSIGESETSLARDISRIFAHDARFSGKPHRRALSLLEHIPLLRVLRDEAGAHVLDASLHGTRDQLAHHISTIRVTLLDGAVGPLGPLAVCAHEPGDDGARRWPDAAIARRLAERTKNVAATVEDDPLSYNGRLIRLRDWRIEVSGEDSQVRIHLLCDKTSYVAIRATTAGLAETDSDWLLPYTLQGEALNRPWLSPLANALSVHVALLTSDQQLVLVRRASRVTDSAARVSSAANGLIELAASRDRGPRGDYTTDGLVDPVAAGIREAHEEVGSHIALTPDRVIVRALMSGDEMDSRAERIAQRGPWISMEARTALTFDDVVAGHFAHTSINEGAFETHGEFFGFSLRGHGCLQTVAWLRSRWREHQLTAGGLVSSLFALGAAVGDDEVAHAWHDASLTPITPNETAAIVDRNWT